jgi:hypothetical protein
MKVMSNKSLLGKNTKTKTNKNYCNFIAPLLLLPLVEGLYLIESVKRRNIAFEISNVKMDKN